MNVEELKILWKEVFGDTDEYLNAFFSAIYDEKNILIHRIDGSIAAALYIIPYDFYMGDKHYTVMYLYALATKEKYRGKGIMSGLINKAHEIGKQRGYILSVLIPAGNSLYQYYEKHGYDILCYQNQLQISRRDIINIFLNQLENNNCYQIKALDNQTFLNLCEKSVAEESKRITGSKKLNIFYLETLRQDGGEIVSIYEKNRKKELYALTCSMNAASSNKQKITVYETNAENDEELTLLVMAISRKYEFQELEIRISYNRKNGNKYKKEFDDYIYRKKYAVIHLLGDFNIDWDETCLYRLLL